MSIKYRKYWKVGPDKYLPTVLYKAYSNAIQHYKNDNNPNHRIYTGQFLFSSFDEFAEHVGKRPTARYNLTLIDKNGDFAPGNVEWVTEMERKRRARSFDQHSTCHPERKHHAHGLCESCYSRSPRRREYSRAYHDKNKVEIGKRRRAHYQAHREEMLARSRTRREAKKVQQNTPLIP